MHVPTPGDHYSPSTGSAIMTIVYELNRRHVKRSEEAVVVVFAWYPSRLWSGCGDRGTTRSGYPTSGRNG